MNKLVLVFGLFALTFLFGLGVTVVQVTTGSFFFPFDSGESLDIDDYFDSNSEEAMDDYYAYVDSTSIVYEEADEYASEVDVAAADTGGPTFTCSDGSLIDAAWTNDGECDCSDCSDESSQSFSVRSERAYFHNEPDPAQRRNAYLVQGDAGTYTAVSGDYVFIKFTNPRGVVSEGWVLLSDLQLD